ncbi:MAG: hypothetical protein WCA84_06550 [Ignavibacteriaceae bacterium]
MYEFIIRVLYFILVILIYFLFESKKIYLLTIINIDYKFLLPVIALVFYDYYLSLFSSFFYKLVINKQLTKDKIIIDLYINYRGLKEKKIHDISVAKIKRIDAYLLYYDKNTRENIKEAVPEKFQCYLGPAQSSLSVKLELIFREDRVSNISFYNIKIFKPKLSLMIDNLKITRTIYLYKWEK